VSQSTLDTRFLALQGDHHEVVAQFKAKHAEAERLLQENLESRTLMEARTTAIEAAHQESTRLASERDELAAKVESHAEEKELLQRSLASAEEHSRMGRGTHGRQVRQELPHVHSELAEVRARRDELERLAEAHKVSQSTLDTRFLALQGDHHEVVAQFKAKHAEAERLLQENLESRTLMEARTTAIEAAHQESTRLASERDELAAKVESHAEEKELLQRSLASAEEMVVECEARHTLIAEIKEFQEELCRFREADESQRSELSRAREVQERQQKRLQTLKVEKDGVDVQLRELEARCEAAENLRQQEELRWQEATDLSRHRLEAELQHSKVKFEHDLQLSETCRDELVHQKGQLEEDLANLHSDLTKSLAEQRSQLAEDFASLDRDLRASEESNCELAHISGELRDELLSCQGDLLCKSEDGRELVRQFADVSVELEIASAQKRALEQEMAQHQDLHGGMVERCKQLENTVAEHARSKEDLTVKADGDRKELVALLEKMALQNETHAKMVDKCQELEAEVSQQEQRTTDLEHELASCRKDLVAITNKFAREKEELATISVGHLQKQGDLEAQLLSAKLAAEAAGQDLEQHREESRNRLESVLAELERVRAEHRGIEEAYQQNTRELEVAKESNGFAAHLAEKEKLERQLKASEDARRRDESELRFRKLEAENQVATLKHKLEQAGLGSPKNKGPPASAQANVSLQRRVEELETRLAERDRRCEDLHAEKSQLMTELTSWRSPSTSMLGTESKPTPIEAMDLEGGTAKVQQARGCGACLRSADQPCFAVARRLATSGAWRRVFFIYIAAMHFWMYFVLNHMR